MMRCIQVKYLHCLTLLLVIKVGRTSVFVGTKGTLIIHKKVGGKWNYSKTCSKPLTFSTSECKWPNSKALGRSSEVISLMKKSIIITIFFWLFRFISLFINVYATRWQEEAGWGSEETWFECFWLLDWFFWGRVLFISLYFIYFHHILLKCGKHNIKLTTSTIFRCTIKWH